MTLASVRPSGAPSCLSGLGPARLRLLVDFVTYGLVSAAALGTDYGLLLAFVALGMHYLAASLLSFSAGSIVAYLLCIRYVFASRRAVSREAELAGFFGVGLAGLVLTQVLLYILVSKCGVPVGFAKMPIIGVVFLFNFLCRRFLVFSGRAAQVAG